MKSLIYSLLLAASVIGMSGCNKDDNNAEGATVRFHLTDAPANYDAIYLEVLGVEVHTSTQGWVTLNSALGVIDLLTLTNGKDTLIASGSFSGNISQVRLILGENNSIIVDNITHPLTIPSGQQSGLKINLHQDLEANKTYEWTIDFDAAKSIHKTGSGDYKMKPVIRAFATEISNPVNGSIHGLVSPIAITAVCAVSSANDTVCTITNITGGFLIQDLVPGTYTVVIEPAPPLDTVVVSNVIVTNAAIDIGVVNL